MIKQFNINKLRNFNNSKNVRILAGKAGSGKSTKMYAKALKYCSRGFNVHYFDIEGSIYGRMFHTYMKKIDNDLFSVNNLPENLSLYTDISSLDMLQQTIVNIAFTANEKTVIILDSPTVLFSGLEGINKTIKGTDNIVSLINLLKLKTFITMQTSRTGTLIIA